MILAGPGRQPADRVRDHLGVCSSSNGRQPVATRQVAGRAAVDAGGVRPAEPATRSSPSTASAARADAIAQASSPRIAAPGAQVNGCLAATPAKIVVQRGTEQIVVRAYAALRRRRQRPHAARVRLRRAPGAGRPGARGLTDRQRDVERDHADGVGDRADLRAAGAQAAQRRRRRLHRHAGVLRHEHDAGARRCWR